MYQHRSRKYRYRSNGRNHKPRDNGDVSVRLRSNSFSNSQTRNHFRTPQSAEKLFEKYNTLAKEALTSGDKTLSENYFQHADHFMRIIENKNINQNQNQNQNKVQADAKLAVSDKHSAENIGVSRDTTIEKKEEKKE